LEAPSEKESQIVEKIKASQRILPRLSKSCNSKSVSNRSGQVLLRGSKFPWLFLATAAFWSTPLIFQIRPFISLFQGKKEFALKFALSAAIIILASLIGLVPFYRP